MIRKTVRVEWTSDRYVADPVWQVAFFGVVQHVSEHTAFVQVTNSENAYWAHEQIVAIDMHDTSFRMFYT